MNAGQPPKPGLARYEHRGAVLEAPPDWLEESMFTLLAPGPKPQPVLALTRLSIARDVTLETFVGQKIAELSQAVAGLEVDHMRETTAGGARAIALRVSWDDMETGRVLQRQLFVRSDPSVFLLTGTAVERQGDKMGLAFEQAASSLRVPGPVSSR